MAWCDINVDDRDIICVLLGLDEGSPAIEINMQIVIVAGRHEIDGMRIHQGGARCLIGMDDSNYEIGPRRASAFGVGKDRRYRRREDEIFRTRDACRCFVGGAYEGEPNALRLDRIFDPDDVATPTLRHP